MRRGVVAVAIMLLGTIGGAGLVYVSQGVGGDADGVVEEIASSREDSKNGSRSEQILPWINTGKNGDPNLFATTDGAKDVYRYLRECYPDEKSSNEDIYEQTPCFKERVEELAKETEPFDFFAGIKAVVVERPDIFAVCHDAGHKGSDILLRRFWDKDADLEKQAEQLRSVFSKVNDTCMSGFIHGLFDTLGYLRADMSSFKAALDACLEAAGVDGQNFDCADGMGHAAWESTLDLKEATALCNLLPNNEKKVLCDGGIIMRMYQHLEKKDPWYLGAVDTKGFEVSDWMTTVASICDTWPENLPRDKGSGEGCWAGVSYLFFKPLYSQLAGDGNDFAKNGELLSSWLRLMGNACDSFGKTGADVCYHSWDQYLVMNSLYEEDNIKVLCSKLEESRSKDCIERGITYLEAERNRSQATK